VSPWIHGRVSQLFQELTNSDFDFTPHLYVKEGAAAAEHLFAVASGLDSLVIGETEITGQVKNAYQAAKDAGLVGKKMNRLFQTALSVVKAIRTNTGIGRGATSVGSVAVELAEKVFDRDLSAKTVMILGAGKMGEACVKHLAKRGAQTVLVANRSVERAERLATEFGGRAVRIEDSAAAMTEADILVSSTGSPDIVLKREDVAKILPARGNRPLVLVDIAVPRDIDPAVADLPNVFLYDIDDLQRVVATNLRGRFDEAVEADRIVSEEVERLEGWLRSRQAVPLIVSLQNQFEQIRAGEMERMRGKLGSLTPQQLEAVDALARGIINKIAHGPIAELRKNAGNSDGMAVAEVIRRAFRLDD